MTKYSYELKKQVVQDYLEGLGGYKKLAKKYNLASKGIILNWLNVYEHYGFEGLEIKRKKRSYTTKFKEKAVQYYVTGQRSYREVANQLGMDNPSLLATWVRKYTAEGTKTFKNNRKSQEDDNFMRKERSKQADSRRVRELEIQLRQARIEIDCLKELRRLRKKKQIKKKSK
jgi:transposase